MVLLSLCAEIFDWRSWQHSTKALSNRERPAEIYQAVEAPVWRGHRPSALYDMRVVDGSDVERVHTHAGDLFRLGSLVESASANAMGRPFLREMKPLEPVVLRRSAPHLYDHQRSWIWEWIDLHIPIVFRRLVWETRTSVTTTAWFRQEDDERAGIMLASFWCRRCLTDERDARLTGAVNRRS